MYRINNEISLSPDDVFRSVFWLNGDDVILDVVAAAVFGISRTKLNRMMLKIVRKHEEMLMFPLSPMERYIVFYSFHKAKSLYGKLSIPFVYTERGIEEAGRLIEKKTNDISGCLFLKAAFKNQSINSIKNDSDWIQSPG